MDTILEEDPYTIELINRDKKNPLVEFVKFIIELLRKIFKK